MSPSMRDVWLRRHRNRIHFFIVILILPFVSSSQTKLAPNLVNALRATRYASRRRSFAIPKAKTPSPIRRKVPEGVRRGGLKVYGVDAKSTSGMENLKVESPASSPSSAMTGIWAARGMLMLCSFLCSTNFATIKIVQETSLSPAMGVLGRFGIAALASLPSLIKSDKRVLKDSLVVGVLIGIAYVFQALGLQTGEASTSAFICSLSVFTVPLIGILIGKPVSASTLVAGMLAVAGVGFLEAGHGATPSEGDLLAFGQPVFFGMSYVLIERITKKYKSLSADDLTTGQVYGVLAVAVAWALFDAGGVPHIQDLWADPKAFAALTYMGIISTVLSIYVQSRGMRKVSASESAVIFTTEPLFATVFSALLIGETVESNTYAGGLAIVLACLINSGAIKIPGTKEKEP